MQDETEPHKRCSSCGVRIYDGSKAYFFRHPVVVGEIEEGQFVPAEGADMVGAVICWRCHDLNVDVDLP